MKLYKFINESKSKLNWTLSSKESLNSNFRNPELELVWVKFSQILNHVSSIEKKMADDSKVKRIQNELQNDKIDPPLISITSDKKGIYFNDGRHRTIAASKLENNVFSLVFIYKDELEDLKKLKIIIK